jgi:hypothetical protein
MKKSVIQTKMSFEDVDHVFGALMSSFHPEEIGEDGPDPRFLALWTLFLQCAFWTEDEYWEAVDELNDEDMGPEEEAVSEKN